MSIQEFLVWLTSSAGVGAALAFFLDRVGAWCNLSSQAKLWGSLGICVLTPLVAQIVLTFVPPEVLMALDPFFKALTLGAVAWLGSQVAHSWEKDRSSVKATTWTSGYWQPVAPATSTNPSEQPDAKE